VNDIETRRGAAVRLAEALRLLNDSAALTEVGVPDLNAATAMIRDLINRLTARTRQGSLASIDDIQRGIRMFNPVSGQACPVAPPMLFDQVADDTPLIGRVTLGPLHEGHIGLAHGGVIALLFDQVLGVAAQRRVRECVTAQLSVRYVKPVRIGIPLTVTGDVYQEAGRQMRVRAAICAAAEPERLLAEADAVLVKLRPEQVQSMSFSPSRS